jgi:hypothetical protein
MADFIAKGILRIRGRNIDSRSGADKSTLIQKSIRPDSIVAYSYSTASARRLVQQNRPYADRPTFRVNVPHWGAG